MESAKRSAAGKVILALQKAGRLYTTQLSYETHVSLRHLSINALPGLVAEGIIKSTKQNNRVYYQLTDTGKIVAAALSNPGQLILTSRQRKKRIGPSDLPASISLDTLKTKLQVTGILLNGNQIELRGTLPKDLLLRIKQEKKDEG
jgi:predicted transcriptional regulator